MKSTTNLFPESVTVKAGRLPLKYGNLKLPESIAVFNLPPVQTCGRHCAGCYAMKSQRQYKETRTYRAEILALSKRPDFERLVISQIKARIVAGGASTMRIKCENRLQAVRVHESGDFYSAAYVKKWERIARALPGVRFYAYTKRLDGRICNAKISAALRQLSRLVNFTLIDSMQYNAVNYGDIAELGAAISAGAYLCPCRSGDRVKICGIKCTYCQDKKAQQFAPVFLKH